MKIKQKLTGVSLDALSAGETFYHCGYLYLKLDHAQHPKRACAELSTGKLVYLDYNTRVELECKAYIDFEV